MENGAMTALVARLEVLEVVVLELARAVPAERAVAVADSVRRRVADITFGASLAPEADEAISVTAASIPGALGGFDGVRHGGGRRPATSRLDYEAMV